MKRVSLRAVLIWMLPYTAGYIGARFNGWAIVITLPLAIITAILITWPEDEL